MSERNACAVTGSSGFVGSIIVRELRKTTPVIGLARRQTDPGDVPWSLADKDISNALRRRGVKTLVHAAWDLHASDRREIERECVAGSEALFSAAERAGVERIVFISTISAFAGCRSVYGQSKLAVEKMLAGRNHVVFRPGLVFGPQAGGVFDSIRKQVRGSRVLPLIGNGQAPQFLLHQTTLADAVARAVAGEFDSTAVAPITLAHPAPIPFRELVRDIAASESRKVGLVPIPWPLLWAGIRAGERAGLGLPFRSDSIVSFVYHDPHPDFSRMRALRIEPTPYR